MKKSLTQAQMFTDGRDLPLFSGTCPGAETRPFVVLAPQPQQLALFDTRPTFGAADQWGKLPRLCVSERTNER